MLETHDSMHGLHGMLKKTLAPTETPDMRADPISQCRTEMPPSKIGEVRLSRNFVSDTVHPQVRTCYTILRAGVLYRYVP